MTEHVLRALGELQRKWVPDRRIGVFDVAVQDGRIEGSTTSREAQAEVRRLGGVAGMVVSVDLLPNASVDNGDVVFAASTAALAPASPLQAEALAADAVPEALERAVRLAAGNAVTPGLGEGGRQ